MGKNNGEGQRTGGTKRTMKRRQRTGGHCHGEWEQRNNGVKGTEDIEQWGQKGIVG